MEKDIKELLNTNTIIKGTDIGYDKDEIKNTSTEDLITLRKSIIGYITSKKLKKKNQKFIDVYVRVTAELKNRKIKTDLRNNQVKTNRRGPGHEVKKEETEGVFLKRKMSFNSLELEIPSFLHDKTQKKPNNNESSSSLSSSSKFKENPITKICIDDFGLSQKLDLESSFDDSTFYKNKKQTTMNCAFLEMGLREMELKSAMCVELQEDLFFNLD